MTRASVFLLAALLAAAGCNEDKSTKVAQTTTTATAAPTPAGTTTTTGAADEEAEIKANLAKLSPEDRALAEKQKFCVEQTDERLGGSMGVPIKLMIKGEPVFICCKGCEKHVLKDQDKALAKAKELREKNSK
jgi:hypothetical protein